MKQTGNLNRSKQQSHQFERFMAEGKPRMNRLNFLPLMDEWKDFIQNVVIKLEGIESIALLECVFFGQVELTTGVHLFN